MTMRTYWLIVQHQDSPKINTDKTKRFDGTKREADAERDRLQAELGTEYIITVETDKVARLYKSYRQFTGSDKQSY